MQSERAYLISEAQQSAAALERRERIPTPWSGDGEPPLARLRRAFGLTDFEHDIVAMCAGYLLDPTFKKQLGTVPTFGFAFERLANPRSDAITATRPLRLYRLVVSLANEPVFDAPLGLDERVFQFLLGIPGCDERLLPYLLPSASSVTLTASQQDLASRIASWLARPDSDGIVQLCGGHALTRIAVLDTAVRANGMSLLRMCTSSLDVSPIESDMLKRTCEREWLMDGALTVLEIDGFDGPESVRTARRFAGGMHGIVAISAPDPVSLTHARTTLFELPATTAAERHTVWREALGSLVEGLGSKVEQIGDQFRLDPAEIAQVASTLDPHGHDEPVGDQLWRRCVERSRPRIEELARRIVPVATWDDLVVPDKVRTVLREITIQLRHRHTVHKRWGFVRGEARGQAITALFCGASGTGKTLAAEVIARETGLDLYHVDLSQVVDKYVGETEKRIRRIFDAAEGGGAILLFDEADALFGKRGHVERGTDRWANIEVSYLLQRMESYHGLAILTTNAKNALDQAFMRRLRFVVPFPFPDVPQRVEMWHRVVPRETPRSEFDIHQLARLQLTGASIRNVALAAAFHSADDGHALSMRHLVRAARAEYAKLEQPFPEAEVDTWAVGPV